MTFSNAKTLPKVFYGLHFYPGVAEYRESGKDPYRIFINEDTIRKMNPTFQGRPVYVRHVSEVNLEKIQVEADGYVIESFYNAADGKTWAKFIIVSDKGHEAIQNGWRLSNAYVPKGFATGGHWNGVDYAKEVTDGEYEHLAIVNDPRYAESIILSPEQFKEYCDNKKLELSKVANSTKQGEESVGLTFFKRNKLENSLDIEQTLVTLPKSKVDKSVAEVVEIADKFLNMHGYAAPEHMVRLQDSEMSVGELADSYNKKCNDEKARLEEAEKKKEGGVEDAGEKKAEGDDKSADKTKKNEDVGDKKEKPGEMKQNGFSDALKNAEKNAKKTSSPMTLDLDKAARGKARYGSN